jgi:endonuclease/exonuclease/phosphatase (EEP) superfamily protein YafD
MRPLPTRWIWLFTAVLCALLTAGPAFHADGDLPAAVTAPAHPGALRVLWWNIFNGNFDPGALGDNLIALSATDAAPDVIALGEYHVDHGLPPASAATLKAKYPYARFFPYSTEFPEKGIYVFSRVPVSDTDYARDALDWTPPLETTAEQQRYRRPFYRANAPEARQWHRSYLRLTLDWHGKRVDIAPVHTAMPWMVMKKMGGVAGKVSVAADITFGRENPLMYQLRRLRQNLRSDPGIHPSDPLVIFGDFNMPKALGSPLHSAPYLLMKRGFRDLFEGASSPLPHVRLLCRRLWEGLAPSHPSFPTAEGRERLDYHGLLDMQLDHAFGRNLGAATAQVLPLRGSDHYPILIDAYPR